MAEAEDPRGTQKEASHGQLCLTLELHIIHKDEPCVNVWLVHSAVHLAGRIHAKFVSESPTHSQWEHRGELKSGA